MKKRWIGIGLIAIILLLVYIFYPRSIAKVAGVNNADQIKQVQLVIHPPSDTIRGNHSIDLMITDRSTINNILTELEKIKVKRSFSDRPDNHLPKNITIVFYFDDELNNGYSNVYIISSRLISINSSRYHASVEDADYSYFDQLYHEAIEDLTDKD